jgi:hypothetical protein
MRAHGVTSKSSLHADIYTLLWEQSSLLDRIIPWQRWQCLIVVGLFVLRLCMR